eukprot:COSAG02_NODE_1572_length_11882_cov_12.033353_4_plen_78_part_00
MEEARANQAQRAAQLQAQQPELEPEVARQPTLSDMHAERGDAEHSHLGGVSAPTNTILARAYAVRLSEAGTDKPRHQ